MSITNEYKMKENHAVVIVTYHPNDDVINGIATAARFVSNLIVVDNTDAPALILSKVEHLCKVIYMNENGGIAKALNVGAEYAFNSGCQFVAFFDQDSNISQSLIDSLLDVITEFAIDQKIAVVGPAYFDTRLAKKAPFITFKQGRLCRVPAEGDKLIEADYIITSGSIISRKSWECIGPHDDSLFIDYVDIEWCLRAKSLGWRVIGVPYVVMEHTLGDEPINVFGKKLPVHSPIRHYYFFRNCISLLRRDYIPTGFKVRELCFLPIRFFVYAFFTKNKLSHITKMSKGLLDGILSKSGPYL
ncbi:MAG: glycosyltransferase family 2 protein [Shewanella sp.]